MFFCLNGLSHILYVPNTLRNIFAVLLKKMEALFEVVRGCSRLLKAAPRPFTHNSDIIFP